MSDNDMGDRKMNEVEEQNRNPEAGKMGKKDKTAGKLRLIKGGAQGCSEPQQSERLKHPKRPQWSKRPTRRELREEREATTSRIVNKRFVNAGACFGLAAFLVSFLLPEYNDHAVIIGICAGVLLYIGLHLVNLVKQARQLAYKLGFFILSTLLLAALIYTFIVNLRG
jgi:hypothetical protein